MKNLLVLIAFVCSVSAEVYFRNSSAVRTTFIISNRINKIQNKIVEFFSQENNGMKLLADCLTVSGLTLDEIRDLKQKTQVNSEDYFKEFFKAIVFCFSLLR